MLHSYQIYLNGDCNLRCRYCYEHKKDRSANSREKVLAFIRHIIKDAEATNDIDPFKATTIEFIGGEVFLHVGLLKEAIETFIKEGVAHGFHSLPIFSISTNGTLFDREDVRDFIETYGRYLSIGFSIDGTKQCHDTNRIDIHGNGTWEKAVEGWKYIQRHVCARNLNVKATFNHDTMHYYADSIISLIELGFTNIAANPVFEETWTDKDGEVFLKQLMIVHRYLRDHSLLDSVRINQINPKGSKYSDLTIGLPKECNHCGSGVHMMALGFNGEVYSCHRFACEAHYPIGHIDNDGNITITMPEFADTIKHQYLEYPEECKRCAFATLCGSCVALPYEEGISAKELFAQKRQCGFTKAMGLAICYAMVEMETGQCCDWEYVDTPLSID